MKYYESFQEAFIGNINDCVNLPNEVSGSRTGKQFERIGHGYAVSDPSTFKFEDENLGRIPYDYAADFYDWMLSGCGTEATEEFKSKYANVKKFLEKPKSSLLPDNFNTFYGPRIVRQLPAVTKELTTKPNSRRAVINILNEEDQLLLDADETLEYPCADSSTLFIRNGKLHQHLHMRSNNMANVVKLDMYLWGRFQCEFAEKLGVKVGHFTSSIASAHVFEADFDYLKSIGIL